MIRRSMARDRCLNDLAIDGHIDCCLSDDVDPPFPWTNYCDSINSYNVVRQIVETFKVLFYEVYDHYYNILSLPNFEYIWYIFHLCDEISSCFYCTTFVSHGITINYTVNVFVSIKRKRIDIFSCYWRLLKIIVL